MFWKKAVAMRTEKECIYQNEKGQRPITWWVKNDTPVIALGARMDGATVVQEGIRQGGENIEPVFFYN